MNNFTIDNYEKLKKINAFIGDPADLVTEDKTIVGAINEIAESSGGGGVIITQNFHTSALNGDIQEITISDAPDTYMKGLLIIGSESVVNTSIQGTAKMVGDCIIFKTELDNAPNYTDSTSVNAATVYTIYYSSGISGLEVDQSASTIVYGATPNFNTAVTIATITANNKFEIITRNVNKYGFRPDTTYTYTAIY